MAAGGAAATTLGMDGAVAAADFPLVKVVEMYGTILDGPLAESDIVAGGRTIELFLPHDQWDPDLTVDDLMGRTGFTGIYATAKTDPPSGELHGWDQEISGRASPYVPRVSVEFVGQHTLIVTLDPAAPFDIRAAESISADANGFIVVQGPRAPEEIRIFPYEAAVLPDAFSITVLDVGSVVAAVIGLAFDAVDQALHFDAVDQALHFDAADQALHFDAGEPLHFDAGDAPETFHYHRENAMGVTAAQVYEKAKSAERTIVVSFLDQLQGSEVLDSGAAASEVDGADLTITAEAITSGAVSVNGVEVRSGAAVTALVAGGDAGEAYTIRVEADSDAGQHCVMLIKLRVVADGT